MHYYKLGRHWVPEVLWMFYNSACWLYHKLVCYFSFILQGLWNTGTFTIHYLSTLYILFSLICYASKCYNYPRTNFVCLPNSQSIKECTFARTRGSMSAALKEVMNGSLLYHSSWSTNFYASVTLIILVVDRMSRDSSSLVLWSNFFEDISLKFTSLANSLIYVINICKYILSY